MKKINLVLVLAIVFALFVCASGVASATTWSGDNDSSANFMTVQAVVNDVNSGFDDYNISSGWKKTTLLGYSSSNAVFCGDVDGDGDMDIATAVMGDVILFNSTGEGQYIQETIFDSDLWTRDVFCIDVDNDGKDEVIAANDNNGTVLLDKTPAGWTETVLLPDLFGTQTSLYCCDMDGDTDIDVVVDGAYFVNNTDTGWTYSFLYSGVSCNDFFCEDIDKDGDVDIICANGQKVLLSENTDDGWVVHSIFQGNESIDTIASTDTDGDGDTEIIAGCRDGNVYLIDHIGGIWTNTSVIYKEGEIPYSVFSEDIDKNGKMDIVVRYGPSTAPDIGHIYLLLNTDEGFSQRLVGDVGNWWGQNSIFSCELEKGGWLEIVSAEGGIHIFTKDETYLFHYGDLVIDDNETLILENCTLQQTGNIIVTDNASLILKNATLIMHMISSEYGIIINGTANFKAEDADITVLGLSSFLHILENAMAYLNTTAITISLEIADKSFIQIQNSTIRGVGCRGGSVLIQNTTLDQIQIVFKLDSKLILEDLPIGNIGFWDLYENNTVEKSYLNITIQNSTLGHFWPSPFGWLVSCINESAIGIKNSTIYTVWSTDNSIVSVYNSTIDYSFPISSSAFSIFNSTTHFIWCWDKPTIHISNTTIVVGIMFGNPDVHIGYFGVICFDGVTLGAVDSYGEYLIDASDSDFYMYGNVTFVESETLTLEWDNSTVIRNYDIICLDQNNESIQNANIELYAPNGTLIWSGTSDDQGLANFNITFNDYNYHNFWTLKANKGNWSALKGIGFLSSTPVVVKNEEPIPQTPILLWKYRTGSNIESITTGDINGDGFGDVIAGTGYPNYDIVAINSNGTFLWNYSIPNRGVAVGDIDGDSESDVIVGAENISAIKNNGSLLWTYIVKDGICSIAVRDVNGDGRNEVIAGGGEMVYCLNGAGTLLWNFSLPYGGRLRYGHAFTLGDVDGDGLEDVVIGTCTYADWSPPSGNSVVVIKSDGTLLWEEQMPECVSSIAVGDMNGDGKNEVVVGVSVPWGIDMDNLYVLKNDGTLLWSYPAGVGMAGRRVNDISLGDLDGDEVKEIVAGSEDNTIYVLKGNGTLLWNYTTSSYLREVEIGDIDGDGINEVIAGGFDSKVYAIKNNGTLLWKYQTKGHIYGLVIGDVNGDRKGDVIVGSRDQNVYVLATVSEIINKTFDTGAPANPYPSIFGTHNGTIKPNVTIEVSKLYTYPCAGTGGHTEYARIWNSTLDVNATWNGYVGDWHNISFDEPFTLFAEKTYYYEIRTGSYPQIIHSDEWEAKGGRGIINCTSFVDANGKIYANWIPAIRLWAG